MTIKKWTEEKIAALHKEGRGVGEGSNYKPWINVRDISSRGRSFRIPSVYTDRTYELFSDVEKSILLLLEYSLEVVEIREQWPLPREATLKHALERGICRHPYYPGTHVPTVMTVDFWVRRRTRTGSRILWIDGKRTEDAKKERSLEKLELVRSYGETLEVPHHVIYHSQICKTMVRNIEWIRSALPNRNESIFVTRRLHELAGRMTDELTSTYLTDRPLQVWCADFDRRHGTTPGTALRVIRMLMWARTFTADLKQKDLVRAPMNSFQRPAESPSLTVGPQLVVAA